jgi:hypothetical protein
MTVHFTPELIKHIEQVTEPADLQRINQLVLFVGHAHSGHSIIGAIMDAHPAMALANEVNIVKAIHEHQLNAQQIKSILLFHSLSSGSQQHWKNSAYIHDIANSTQGQTSRPTVIGDKKAGGSTRIFFRHPALYSSILRTFGEQLRIIFVRRNPLDVVAAYSHYMQQPVSQFHVTRYIENLNTVRQVQKQTPKAQFLEVCQRDFVNNPVACMSRIFAFTGLPVTDSELQRWTAHVRSDLAGKSASIALPEELTAQLAPYLNG